MPENLSQIITTGGTVFVIMVILTCVGTLIFPSERSTDYDYDYEEDEPEDEKVIRSQLRELTSNPEFMTEWVYQSESDKFALIVDGDVLTLSDTFLEINGTEIDCGYRLDDEIEASYDRMTEFTEDEDRVSEKIIEVMSKVLS